MSVGPTVVGLLYRKKNLFMTTSQRRQRVFNSDTPAVSRGTEAPRLRDAKASRGGHAPSLSE